jgi:large subunit ribosomal protein L10
LAITKEQKNELVSQYVEWMKGSQAMIVSEYRGLTMKQLDDLRAKVREAGGEFHVVKNTLGKVAFREAGMIAPEALLEGSTAFAFAFKDAAGMAKVMTDFTKTAEMFKIKGGYLGKTTMTPAQVKALADLPPLPVVRARLLGVLVAPASQLARTLAEPARQMASVLKAFADKEGAAAEPAADAG